MTIIHKKDRGTIGELTVAIEALANGCSVFTEFGDNSKIDLIIEDPKGKIHKVQVKTVGREPRSPDVSILYLYKSGPNYQFTYTVDMVDWFAVFDEQTKKIAWINAGLILTENSSAVNLRHIPPKNGQTKKIRMFEDYMTFPFGEKHV